MKIQVDGKDVFELTETKSKVMKNDIPDENFKEDIERRARYVIQHKYERCFQRLKKEWEPKLAKTTKLLPTDNDAFAELVFSQADYKDRSQRDAEEEGIT